jgi:hypothetical protein
MKERQERIVGLIDVRLAGPSAQQKVLFLNARATYGLDRSIWRVDGPFNQISILIEQPVQ